MIFPGFPGVLSFFQVFQLEWEPWPPSLDRHPPQADNPSRQSPSLGRINPPPPLPDTATAADDLWIEQIQLYSQESTARLAQSFKISGSSLNTQ